MDSPDFPSGKSPRSLQGPRPAPLKVHKDSHKIKKPPIPPHHHQPQQHHHHQHQQPPHQHRPPVIIYTVSPKVIHTNPNEFMNLVQRLTGPNASSSPIGSSYSAFQDDGGAVSPAARFASIENAVKSPDGRRQLQHQHQHQHQHLHQHQQQPITSTGDLATDNDGFEMGYFPPGILSPAPGSLPPIPPNFFSPVQNDFFHDLSPGLNSNSRNYFNSYMEGNNFMPSPTNLLSSHIISPTTPNLDLFHSLFD